MSSSAASAAARTSAASPCPSSARRSPAPTSRSSPASRLPAPPAPASSHPIHGAIQAAKRADESGTSQVILFNLSGHGHFDMAAYEAYLHGNLEEYELPEEEIERALKAIEPLPKPAVRA